MLGAPFAGGSGHIAFEIDEDEIVFRDQHLPQVQVAVMASLHHARRLAFQRAGALSECGPCAQQFIDVRLDRQRQSVARFSDTIQHLLQMGQHLFAPCCEVRLRHRLRIECRIAGAFRQRAVKFGDALAEQGHLRQIKTVRHFRDFGQRVRQHAIEILERIRPDITLVAHELLQDGERARFAALVLHVFDRARDGCYVRERR